MFRCVPHFTRRCKLSFFLRGGGGREHCCCRILVSSSSFRSSVLCPYFVWELAWRNDLQYPERSTRGYTLYRLGTLFWNLKALRLSFGERWCMLLSPSVHGLRYLIATDIFLFYLFFLKFMTWCSLTSRRVVCVCRLLVITKRPRHANLDPHCSSQTALDCQTHVSNLYRMPLTLLSE